MNKIGKENWVIKIQWEYFFGIEERKKKNTNRKKKQRKREYKI